MDCVFIFLCCTLGGIAGLFAGVYDCKRTYGIPHKAQPEDGEWVFYDDGVVDGNNCTD